MYICIYVCIYVYMYICIYVYMYILKKIPQENCSMSIYINLNIDILQFTCGILRIVKQPNKVK